MGSLTAKTSGDIASFMTPAKTNIKSLKVHFSPKQLGTGDPSPENIREIVGWDGVEVVKSSVNLLDQSYITKASGWALSSDDGNTTFCGVPVYKGTIAKLYQKFKSGYPFVGNSFKENVQYNISAWLKTVNGNSLQGLKFGFKYTDGTTSLGGIFTANDTWKRQTVTSKANKTVSGIYCSYNSSGEIYLCGLAVCEKELDDISVVYPSSVNDISIDWSNDIDTVYGGYVDLINGELVETCVLEEYTSNDTWQEGTASSQIMYQVRRKNIPTGAAFVSNLITRVISIGSSMNNVGYAGGTYLNIKMTSITTLEDFLTLLESNPLQIAYTLASPITHQLTPTQLQSFVGQNNFWSNADYVEVEYDLIETIDIQKAKQKIILNQPQLKTISNKVVSFNTDMVAPMKNCKIYFKPIQLGSGDPSITNFRDIKGWTGIDAYVNGDKISVDWTNEVGTRYSGYIDLVKGELVIDWIYFLFSRSSKVSSSGITSDGLRTWMTLRITHKVPPYQVTPENGDDYGLFSIGDWRNGAVAGRNRAFVNATYVYAVITNDTEDLTTAEGRTAFFDQLEASNIPIEVVYKRATPLRFQLTPQQLLILKSTNHIWSETNGQQIDVKYWTHKNLTPTPLINYLENQTWTDSAYISSTGKKTVNGTSASHFLTNQILLEAGTYVLSGFSYYVGSDNTNYRIHAYDSTGKWLRQITFQQIDNLSPVDISFTLDTDTYVNVSIAMDFDGVLAKIN